MRKLVLLLLVSVAAFSMDSCIIMVPHGESYRGRRYVSPHPHNYTRRTHVVHPRRSGYSGGSHRYGPRR